MSENIENHIEREVQRRLSRHIGEYAEEISGLKEKLQLHYEALCKQRQIVSKLTADPAVFGILLKQKNHADPDCFSVDDEVLVVDRDSPYYRKTGKIVADDRGVVDENGCVCVRLFDGTIIPMSIGLEGKTTAQVRLIDKADGTSVIVHVDGKPWEVRGVPDLKLSVGDIVKVHPNSKAVLGKVSDVVAGPICHVVSLFDDYVEVSHRGNNHVLFNAKSFPLAEGDRVLADSNMFCVLRKLAPDTRNRYKIEGHVVVGWDDIGGLTETKEQLKNALELPFQHPELFSYYNVEPVRGILLYGPPGCGKTLLAKAAATSISQFHGKQAVETGYFYVKSPEILDKWVGNTEKEIRNLFNLARQHYREHGYKAVLVFDEADAILPQRGTRRSSDVSDTIVPMFLGEMDGVDAQQTIQNPIVILMTNRADVLDPAVIRPGRINHCIKVERPNEDTAIDILQIHAKNIPFSGVQKTIFAVVVSDIFSQSRILYRVNGEYNFTLGDCVSGAMLSNIVEIAKMTAIHRDLKNGSRSGVDLVDLRNAVEKVYKQQKGINHNYDLQDFADRLGIQLNSAEFVQIQS